MRVSHGGDSLWWSTDSRAGRGLVVAHGLSCPAPCGILGIKLTRDQTHVSSLAGGFLTMGPPEKSHDFFFALRFSDV